MAAKLAQQRLHVGHQNLEHPGLHPVPRLLVHRRPRRQIVGHVSPLVASPHDVAHTVEQIPQTVPPTPAVLTAQQQIRQHKSPFLVRHILRIKAFLQNQIAAKLELVQISTAYGHQQEGSKIVTRHKYVEVRQDAPDTTEKAKWPEFKTCKYVTEAIVSEGIDKGEIRKLCTQPDCSIHHPTKQPTKADANLEAEQEKRRKEEAQSNAIEERVLQTIVAAVPVRLMRRDLLFIAEQMLPLLDDKRLEMVARHRDIRAKEGEATAKLLSAFVRKAEESDIGKLIVEAVILLSART